MIKVWFTDSHSKFDVKAPAQTWVNIVVIIAENVSNCHHTSQCRIITRVCHRSIIGSCE